MWGAIPFYFTVDRQGSPALPTVSFPLRGTRDTLRNGGMQTWDLSLFKNIPLGNEARYIQLRLEAFNAFNHPNFETYNYGYNVTGPWQYTPTDPLTISRVTDWGKPSDTYGTGPGGFRVIQLGAKIYF